ncbi:invasion associated locus B family protein [Bosea sp. NBC_00550]|uniref:invasion associated locus B family protein n=1 Tax=Bosea sp. NBC_00550 TaxID=2969621 RepID=UPI002232214A|nr:invasion associated locus B family protein [Bosea sp. NBC_00550]UZF90490.1 invasion associated locus B family protein [Bosea sp. NBC_00550]
MIKNALSAIFLVVLGASAAEAATPKLLGQFNAWNAAAYENGDTQRCFIMSKPQMEEPSELRHGEVLFFVQTGARGSDTESSFQAGYDFAKDSIVTVTIGDNSFRMLTEGSNAWIERLEREPALLAAMRAGNDMVLEARSARGNATTYTFSLTGVTAASRMLQRCNSDATQS